MVVAFLLFLSVGLAAAQIPTSGNIFFGYSYYSTDVSPIDRANTNGWNASLEGKVFPLLGIVADFSGHYGSANFPFACGGSCPPVPALNISEHDLFFGPRFSVPVGKFRPFAEAMFGVGHINADAAGSDTAFNTALGGGIDYRLVKLIALRVEGDYVRTHFFGADQNNVRLSTGIAVHF
jgi:opacity protein-like surface antigen